MTRASAIRMRGLLAVLAAAAIAIIPPVARGIAQAPPPAGAAPAAKRPPQPKAAQPAVAKLVEVRLEEGRTRFLLSVSEPVTFTTYTLDGPYRVVIDVSDLQFALPQGSGQKGGGLISSFRYGLIAPRRSRVVLDITGAMKIESAQLMTSGPRGPHFLVVDILGVEPAAFQRSDPPAQPAATAAPAALPGPLPGPAPGPARVASKPVVVIDPGHGGIDSGTQGAFVLEKDIVLQVALQVRRLLLAAGKVEVHMTRTTDVFVSLDERLRQSQELEASLFISIHADSVGAIGLAQSVRGATIYTLSERASDDAARALADKENAADSLAGLDTAAPGDKDQVLGILFDLVRRDTSNLSAVFQSGLIASLGRHVAMAREPRRSAAFKVLKQPQSPSVLIELGYMSNAEDEALMRTAEWQRNVAQAIAKAVHDFFAARRP